MDNYEIYLCGGDAEIQNSFFQILKRHGCAAILKEPSKLSHCVTRAKKPFIVFLDKKTTDSKIIDIAQFRQMSYPVIFILILRENEMNNRRIAETLEAGVDDFISFSIDENVFMAKLRAYLRRFSSLSPTKIASEKMFSQTGLFKIDKSTLSIFVKEKKRYKKIKNFTPTEFKIISLFIENNSLVIERKLILERIWGNKACKVNTENIDKHIESIRKKLGKNGEKIKTVYGTGYMFSE